MTQQAKAKRRKEAPANDDNLLERFLKESHQPGAESARARANSVKGCSPRERRITFEKFDDIELPTSWPYLLKGLINRSDLSVWYGPRSSGKSFMGLYIAHAIATGRKIFGRRVRKAPVAYFYLEGAAAFAKRKAAIKSEYGDAEDLFIYRTALVLRNADVLVAEVIERVKECGAKLVIFDTLARTMGGGNENDFEVMGEMVRIFDAIKSQTGAHVMVIHHIGKDKTKGMRGHSSLPAAIDVAVEFDENKHGDKYWTIEKNRDDSDDGKVWFRLKKVEIGEDDDRERMSSCVVEEMEEPIRSETKAASSLTKRQADMIEMLAELIEAEGETPRFVPKDVRAVRRSRLLDYAVGDDARRWKKRDSAEEPLKKLIASGAIAEANGYLWPKT